MQINFNIPLMGLNGLAANDEKGNETTLGRVLASVLANSNKGNALKLMGWAKKIWNCEIINLDKSDRKMLIELVENMPELTNLTKNAILELIDINGED